MIYNKENIDMSVVQCPYEEDRGYIYISDEYTNNILKLSGYSDIDEYDYQIMCEYKFLEPYLYEYALKSASNVYHYTRVVIKGRFELGESVISTSAYYSFMYARIVGKGRFELGESVVSTSDEYSYWYARDILKGRFELGEQAVSTSAEYSFRYAEYVLNGRFELGESAISTSAYYSCMYAVNVIKGRFELGEPAITVDSELKEKYKQLTGIEL